jgi:hypothetical protein
MATIPLDFGKAGKGVVTSDASPNLKDVLFDIVDDLTALRTSQTTLTAKLDLDAGVTDTNYAALCNPAALKSVKGT